jgi:hypothetical protein
MPRSGASLIAPPQIRIPDRAFPGLVESTMKKLTALALIVFGLVAAHRALAQQSGSTDDDRLVLARKASESSNTELQKLLHSFTAIPLKGYSRERCFLVAFCDADADNGAVYVPGDIKTRLYWNSRTIQAVLLKTGGQNFTPVRITPGQLQELTRRKRALIAAGVTEAPAPTQEELAFDRIAWDRLRAYLQREDRLGNWHPPLPPWPWGRETEEFKVNPKETETGQSSLNSNPQWFTAIGLVVLIVIGTVLIAINPMKKVTGLIFLLFGVPAWLWTYSWVDLKISNIKAFFSASSGHRGISVADPAQASLLHYAWGFSIFWLLFFIVDLIRNRNRSKPIKPSRKEQTPYWAAEKGIPHCRFERTPEGFKAAINDSDGVGGAAMFLMLTVLAVGILSLIYGSTTALLVIFTAGSAMAYFCAKRPPTRIEVTRDAVIVDKTYLKKSDFRSFNLSSKTTLGCEYGLRSFGLRGQWKPHEAEEIAAALNMHLLITPITTGTTSQPAPEDLRRSRPTDF